MEIRCDVETRGKTLVIALPTAGHISELAIAYLIDKKIVKEAGYIITGKENLMLIDKGAITYPTALYSLDNALFLFSYVPLDEESLEQIKNWIVNAGFKEVVILESIPVNENEPEDDLFIVKEGNVDFEIKGAKKLEEGVLVGESASIILRLKDSRIPIVVLLTEAHIEMPDGIAAANLIKGLEYLIGEVDTKELVADYKKRLSKIHRLSSQFKKGETGETHVPIYG
jgi:predicted ATP-grasp superfamily ATP-dependent carboligase